MWRVNRGIANIGPARELDEFNRNILGRIEVLQEFGTRT
jgi:hypothetical protein